MKCKCGKKFLAYSVRVTYGDDLLPIVHRCKKCDCGAHITTVENLVTGKGNVQKKTLTEKQKITRKIKELKKKII